MVNNPPKEEKAKISPPMEGNSEIPLPRPGDDGFRQTGLHTSSSRQKWYEITTRDLLIMSIVGVMGGFISGTIPFSALVEWWYPMVGGTQLVSGHHILWMILAYGLTRKKIAFVYTAAIKALVMFLIGGQWGIIEVVFSLYEGCCTLIFIVIAEKLHEGNTYLGWGIAGGLGNMLQVPLFWLVNNRMAMLPPTLAIPAFILAIMFAFISGVLIAGVLGRFVVVRLEKVGIA